MQTARGREIERASETDRPTEISIDRVGVVVVVVTVVVRGGPTFMYK